MDTSDIRKGLKMMVDSQPYVVIDFQFVKPGKGQAFTRVKIRNMATAAVLERTYKSGEKLDDPDVEEKSMSFLYKEADTFHFMDQRSYEQVEIVGDAIGEGAQFLLPEMVCAIMLKAS